MVARAAMKCSLNVAMVCSAAFFVMVAQGNKLDVDCFGPDELLDRGGTLVVHYIQCRIIAAEFQYGDDFGDFLYHGSTGARQHGPVNDCIKVIDVGNKHVLHTFEGVDWEGAGDVSINGARYGTSECSKGEHILHSKDFLRGKHAINLGTCGNNVELHTIAHGGCIGLVSLYVSLVGSGGAQLMAFD